MNEPKKIQSYKYIRKQPYLFGFTYSSFTGLICTLSILLFSLFFLYHIIIWDIIVIIGCLVSVIYFRFFHGVEYKFLSKNYFPKELNDFTK